ncbi:hypothetical protein [Streptomyces sp. IBSBF 2950]|uniref:hypothetical protein n=1 Tax=Streptomyces sp. IBSBF 2950 TaxID=2903528 RepID=UPI002FDC1E4F
MTTDRAALVIARARESWTNNPEARGDSADAFDFHISTVGLQRAGELYQEVYALANEDHPVVAGGGEEQLQECKERADRLWGELRPELEAFAAGCRNARFTGWSAQSEGPIRRVS